MEKLDATFDDETPQRRTVLKAGLVATTGIAGLSTVGFAQNDRDADDYVITLTVVDQNGNPLQEGNAVVMGTDAEILGERALDENGQATWEVSQEGEYSYNVYDVDGYELGSDETSFEVDGDTDLTVEMEESDDENTITVTVRDEETDEPIEGATVELVGSLSGPAEALHEGETNSDGVYETSVPAVRHEVGVDLAEGYYANDATADLSEGDVEVTVELTPKDSDDEDNEEQTDEEHKSPSDGDETDNEDSNEGGSDGNETVCDVSQ